MSTSSCACSPRLRVGRRPPICRRKWSRRCSTTRPISSATSRPSISCRAKSSPKSPTAGGICGAFRSGQRAVRRGRRSIRSQCCSTNRRNGGRAGRSTSSAPMCRTARSTRRAAGATASSKCSVGSASPRCCATSTRPPRGWQVREDVRCKVRFHQHNILGPFPGRMPFDLVLCRNVLLYFDRQVRTQAFARLSSAVMPDGFLMLGAGETVVGQTDRFVPTRPARELLRARRPARRTSEDRVSLQPTRTRALPFLSRFCLA